MYQLFPLNTSPLFLQTYNVRIRNNIRGINIMDDMKRNNMDLGLEAFLSLVQNQSSNLSNLGEVLLPVVKELMQSITLKAIVEF